MLPAQGVLDIVLDMLDENDFPGIELTLEAYKNGRENGFTFSYYPKGEIDRVSVTFAENRNSDKIVVYKNFVTSYDTYNEEAYENAKRFTDTIEAAHYIIESLKPRKHEI